MVVWGGLTNSWEKRSERQRRQRSIYSFESEFQRIARRDKKAFLSDQCKEIEENTRMGKTRDLFKKIRDTKVTFHASSVQFSRSVVSNSLQPHELQHARPPCPLPIPGVYSNSCPLSQWCLPAIRVFSNESTLHMSWPKYWSFSFSISPSNEHPGLVCFRMDWLDLLADYQESSPTPQFKSISSSVLSFLYGPTLTSIHY